MSKIHGDTRLCRKTPSSARERAIFLPDKDGEAGDVGFIVDTAGCRQAEKGPLEARSGFSTEPNMTSTRVAGKQLGLCQDEKTLRTAHEINYRI